MRFKARTDHVLASPARCRCTAMAIRAGTKVRERMKAANSAMITVSAIGWNIFPSTPVNVSSGT